MRRELRRFRRKNVLRVTSTVNDRCKLATATRSIGPKSARETTARSEPAASNFLLVRLPDASELSSIAAGFNQPGLRKPSAATQIGRFRADFGETIAAL
jgi:hypothetical protein